MILKQFPLNPSLNTRLGTIINVFVALTRIARLAKRLNIRDIIASAVHNGDNMIDSKRSFLATSQTLMIILLTKGIPFTGRVRTPIPLEPSTAAMSNGGYLIGICLSPNAGGGILLVRIYLSPFAAGGKNLAAILSVALPRVGAYLIGVSLVISFAFCPLRFWVSTLPSSVTFSLFVPVIFSPFSVAFLTALWVILCPCFLASYTGIVASVPLCSSTIFTWATMICFCHKKSPLPVCPTGALCYNPIRLLIPASFLEVLPHLPGFLFQELSQISRLLSISVGISLGETAGITL